MSERGSGGGGAFLLTFVGTDLVFFAASTRNHLRTITLSVSTSFRFLLFLMVTINVRKWSTWSSIDLCGGHLGTGSTTGNFTIALFLPEAL